MRTPRGFTLIELLVVIAIIGMLASIVMASLNTARAKSRDARRLGDLHNMALALELYYSTNNAYPISQSSTWASQCAAWGSLSANNVIPGLIPTYMSAMPSDPSMNTAANTCCYIYNSNGTDYKLLIAHSCGGVATYTSQPSVLDPTRDGGSNGCTIDTSGAGAWAWSTYSSGAACW